ncbi:Putative inorganic phosphate cotransporter [Araneus ventricosus]|uniref:Inorganic phosphate cotransporter n=1 Tax=Araneus ventricosus TaxID=182803 RepID=A0A4Y2QYQ5_ARAVE|nr:Putative inorganic phosphate cotransporter [Araneus ventricosus]GBN68441.1 Putative inorganic phosphate cotransporter [Araneus ventricosus]
MSALHKGGTLKPPSQGLEHVDAINEDLNDITEQVLEQQEMQNLLTTPEPMHDVQLQLVGYKQEKVEKGKKRSLNISPPTRKRIKSLIGCLWFVLWCLLVTDTPLTHPLISEKELKYITSNQRVDHRKEVPPIPWKKILTSVPFWAVFVTATCQDWAFFIIMNDLPTFFSTILHFSIEENGVFSSLPHLTHTIVSLAASSLADFIIRRKIASTTFVRKFWNSVSEFGTALGLVGVCFAGCDIAMNKFLFIFAIAIGGFAHSGYVISFLDMSPEYAGTLWGMASTISNLNGFIAPLVVGALTNEENTLRQWRIVFIMTACILAFASVVFIFFSSSEKQDWAEQEPSKAEENDEILTVPKTASINKYIPLN